MFLEAKSLRLKGYETVEEFYQDVKSNGTTDFCFGFEMTMVHPGIKEVNITYMFPRDVAANTYEPLYDPTTRVPNWRAWNSTFLYG